WSILDNWAWLRNVSVERFDDFLELLFYNAALELHRERQRAVVEGEIVGQERETLDGLVLREMRSKARDFRFDKRANKRIADQVRVRAERDSLLRGFRRNGRRVRNNKSHNEFAPVAHDHGIQDVRAGLQRIFDRLRRDEFSTGGLEQIFLSVSDEQIVVFVGMADIARVEPAVLGYHFTRGFRSLVVALPDSWALHWNLAIVRGAVLRVSHG